MEVYCIEILNRISTILIVSTNHFKVASASVWVKYGNMSFCILDTISKPCSHQLTQQAQCSFVLEPNQVANKKKDRKQRSRLLGDFVT